MKKNNLKEKIHLTSVDELFGLENAESSIEIEIDRIRSFKDHPFKVQDDDKMADLVDSNIQREELLPSEKAFALKMKLEAMKRKAGRPAKDSREINSSQNESNFEEGNYSKYNNIDFKSKKRYNLLRKRYNTWKGDVCR